MIKVKYKILYKNGIEDEIVQEATEDVVIEINSIIYESFKSGENAVITLGDGFKFGHYIRIKDVSRISTVVLEDE